MNASNNPLARKVNTCQGLDCAIVQIGASDWFGDLEISDDVEEVVLDQFGDMTGV